MSPCFRWKLLFLHCTYIHMPTPLFMEAHYHKIIIDFHQLASPHSPYHTYFVTDSWTHCLCFSWCRMIADPSFLYQLILEQAATIGCSVWWEVKNRKERYQSKYSRNRKEKVSHTQIVSWNSLFLCVQDQTRMGFGSGKCSDRNSLQHHCCLVTCALSFVWEHIPFWLAKYNTEASE